MFVAAFIKSIFEYEPVRQRFLNLPQQDTQGLWQLATQLGVTYSQVSDDLLRSLAVVIHLMLKKKERYDLRFEDCEYMLNMWGIGANAA